MRPWVSTALLAAAAAILLSKFSAPTSHSAFTRAQSYFTLEEAAFGESPLENLHRRVKTAAQRIQEHSLQSHRTRAAKRVVVVGSGISGAFAAWTLRRVGDELGLPLDIRVAESRSRLGGRTATLRVNGDTVLETGASILHGSNRNLVAAAELLGLSLTSPREEGRLFLWNGTNLVFSSAGSDTWNALKVLFTYGIAPFSTAQAANSALAHFVKLYNETAHRSFSSADDMLAQVQLMDLVREPLHHVLPDDTSFFRDFIQAIMRVNYAQDARRVNALTGLVSLIGGGTDLYAVHGGNNLIHRGLFSNASATVHTGCTIDHVYLHSSSSITIASTPPNCATGDQAHVDAVILAGPAHNQPTVTYVDDVSIPATKECYVLPRPANVSYRKLHVTFVWGILNRNYFGSDMPVPLDNKERESILATQSGLFNSISALHRFENGTRVYKIFSDNMINDEDLRSMFSQIQSVDQSHMWEAYPLLPPRENLGAVVRGACKYSHVGVFSAHALEHAVSAMEVQSIAGWNAAIIALEHLMGVRKT